MTEPTELETNGRRGLFSRAARGASDRVLSMVDPDVVLDHIDVNALMDRVDVNSLLDRVDVNALLDRVDVDALMERVDLEKLVERAGIPEIVAESTARLGGSALDLFRRPIVGIDEIVFRFFNRLVRRDPNTFPEGPGALVDWVDEHVDDRSHVATGRYAGPITRLLAIIIDAFVVSFSFTLILAAINFVAGLVSTGLAIGTLGGVILIAALVAWAFVYLSVGFAVFGKTIGKAVMGARVVSADGSTALRGRQSVLRTLVFPVSILVFGLGLFGIVFGRERSSWHDRAGRTAVVYDWGSRTAQMPTPLADWLDRRQQLEG